MPRKNFAGVAEVAHLRTDLEKYGENYDHIFGKKKDEKEEDKREDEEDLEPKE